MGGISILKEIQKQLPHEDLIYIADSAKAPYGDKPVDFIQQRSLQLSQFLLTQNIKVLVVACNTATTEAISFLRAQLNIPVVGVEPAIKPAAEQSKNKIIGILATHRTINSERLQELIDLYAKDSTIVAQSCPGLVEAVENHDANNVEHSIQLLRKYTQKMVDAQVDTLILGCTHYPFLLAEMRILLGDEITILDTGKPVATQLQRILEQNNIQHTRADGSNEKKVGTITFYSSLNEKQHHETLCKLWGAQGNGQDNAKHNAKDDVKQNAHTKINPLPADLN